MWPSNIYRKYWYKENKNLPNPHYFKIDTNNAFPGTKTKSNWDFSRSSYELTWNSWKTILTLGVCVLSIKNNNIKILFDKIFWNKNIEQLGENWIFFAQGTEDPRIYQKIDKSINLLYNYKTDINLSNIECDIPFNKYNKTGGKVCVVTAEAPLNITLSDNDNMVSIEWNKQVNVCKNLIKGKWEKNWSYYKDNDKEYYFYLLNPFIIYTHSNNNKEYCEKNVYNNSSELVNFFNYYSTGEFGSKPGTNKYNVKLAQFSMGSSAIKYSNNEMIGVGHCKVPILTGDPNEYPYKHPHLRKHSDKPNKYFWIEHPELLKNFEVINNATKPGIYRMINIYLMFVYTFDPYIKQITRLSHCFIPYTNKESYKPFCLVFPTGISISPYNKVIISYGEGDVKRKCLITDKKYIESILIPVNKLNPNTYKFSVDKLNDTDFK